MFSSLADTVLKMVGYDTEDGGARTRAILDHSADAYLEVDSSGVVTDWNSQAEKIFGYLRADLLGQALAGLIIPCRNRDLFQESLKKPSERLEITALQRGGKELQVQLTMFRVPGGLGAFARDLSVVTAEKLHRDLMDQLAEPYVEVDLRGKFVFVNKSYCEVYGVAAQSERAGVSYKDAIAPQSQAAIKEAYQEVYRTGIPCKVEYPITAISGAETYVETSVSLRRDAHGNPAGFLAFARDLSARKRYEDEMAIARDAAEAASQAKGEFLANMSHEIRTPLNGVIGMLGLARGSGLTAEQGELIEIAATSANSLLGVINDILDFSKIEARKLQFDSVEFNLREMVAKVTRGMAINAHEKGLELAYSVAPELPRLLLGDPMRLTQVLMNLLGNAIKFTSRGEVVLRVAADLEGREATLRFSVSDTGIGIEPEKQDLIFDAFSQADASTTRMFGGTGLGLTICTRIVQLMGGRIWVESAAGKGSTFHFTTQCAVPDQAVASAAHSPMAGVRVLVVDDNSTNLGILKAMLAFSNMRPALAGSGAAALAMLTQAHAGDPFRVMLVDRHMPYMDGFELVERIQRDLHLTLPAVMMLTSSDYQAASKRCREIGVSASLIKPVAEGDLLAALKAVFEPEAAPPADAEVENGSRRHSWSLKILLAEDNVINQKLATRLLEKLGHRVVLAGNGREALDALEAACFELVLMDVQMPEMDGFTATAAIRAKEEATGTHIPIVALTAHAMTGDRERCLKAGMDDYLVKPIDPVLLREAIERATAAVTSCR